jgi:hypothetical protein
MGSQYEMAILQGLRAPQNAADKTVRMCDTEQDAIAVSITLSTVSQAEIARRVGVSEQLVSAWKSGERPMRSKHVGPFCSATGSNLLRQYRALQSMMRAASGTPRAADRIASIASYSMGAAAA